MTVPFVSFRPLEKELDSELRAAFERVYSRSWYILGDETEAYFGLTRQDFKYHFTVSD